MWLMNEPFKIALFCRQQKMLSDGALTVGVGAVFTMTRKLIYFSVNFRSTRMLL